jgi:hypothetical protein
MVLENLDGGNADLVWSNSHVPLSDIGNLMSCAETQIQITRKLIIDSNRFIVYKLKKLFAFSN